MGQPYVESPLGGNLGASTASVYRLDPTGTVPIEPLPDAVIGLTPLRVTADVIDQERYSVAYSVTRNPLQNFADATTNVRKQPRILQVAMTFSATPQLVPFVSQPSPLGLIRSDLIRLKALERIADARQPVLVVTPRQAVRGFISAIDAPYSPDDGESIVVTITVTESRIVAPLTGALVPDPAGLATGNNAVTSGGDQAAATATTQTVSAPPAPGAAPQIGA